MVEFSASIAIAAAPATVWRTLIDISREPRWMAAVRSVDFLGERAAYVADAHMRRSGTFLGFKLVWQSEVTACEPERLIAFGHSGALRGESRWEIQPQAGGSRVRFWSSGPAPGPLKLLPGMAAWAGRKGLEADLTRLKREVES